MKKLFLTVLLFLGASLGVQAETESAEFQALMAGKAITLDSYFSADSYFGGANYFLFISTSKNLTMYMSCHPGDNETQLHQHRMLNVRIHMGSTKAFSSQAANLNPRLVYNLGTGVACKQLVEGLKNDLVSGKSRILDLSSAQKK